MSALTDTYRRPLRDLRISVTDRCNFRCPYCMPKEVFGPDHAFLRRRALLTYEEIARLARLFARAGVTKVRLTGGEPLVRRDLPLLVEQLAAIPGIDDLTLTTNGVLLPRHAEALAAAGLHRVTVSLDSLDPEVYRRMNDVGEGPEAALAGIEAAERAGLAPIKVNAVVERGVNDHTLVDLARHFHGTGHILRFIEFMDVGNSNAWSLDRVVPSREVVERIDAVLPLEAAAPNYRGEVARRYRYRDGGGEIGVISSVTQPFCGDCTRARLSSEGRLYTCLFAGEGFDLRELVRGGADDDEIAAALARVWGRREDRYSETRSDAPSGTRGLVTLGSTRREGSDAEGRGPGPKVEMSHIGG